MGYVCRECENRDTFEEQYTEYGVNTIDGEGDVIDTDTHDRDTGTITCHECGSNNVDYVNDDETLSPDGKHRLDGSNTGQNMT